MLGKGQEDGSFVPLSALDYGNEDKLQYTYDGKERGRGQQNTPRVPWELKIA